MNQILLMWPARELNPNSRVHWSVKYKANKIAVCHAMIETERAQIKICEYTKIIVSIVFNPPDKRGRDMDNCLASCKAYLDGIARSLNVNDKNFVLHLSWGQVVRGGSVEVILKCR